MHILTSYSQVRKALRSTGLSDTYKVKRQMMTMMNLTRWTLRGNFQSSKARAMFHQVCWENELKRSSIRSRQKVECFALVFEKCQLNCLLPQQVQWNYEIRVWTYWIWNTKLKIYQFQDFLLAGLSSYELGCLALEQGVLMERAGFAIWVSIHPLWHTVHCYRVLLLSRNTQLRIDKSFDLLFLPGSVIIPGRRVASGQLSFPKPNQPSA